MIRVQVTLRFLFGIDLSRFLHLFLNGGLCEYVGGAVGFRCVDLYSWWAHVHIYLVSFFFEKKIHLKETKAGCAIHKTQFPIVIVSSCRKWHCLLTGSVIFTAKKWRGERREKQLEFWDRTLLRDSSRYRNYITVNTGNTLWKRRGATRIHKLHMKKSKKSGQKEQQARISVSNIDHEHMNTRTHTKNRAETIKRKHG